MSGDRADSRTGVPRGFILAAGALAAVSAAVGLGSLSAEATTMRGAPSLSGFGEISVVGVDGRGLRRLTPPGQFDWLGGFTPDGRRLLFVTQGPGGYDGRPRVMGLDGKGRTLILPKVRGRIGGTVIWSPDRRQVAFQHRTGYTLMLSIVEVSTGQLWPLAEDASPCGWSPDGGLFAYYTSPQDERVVVTDAVGRRLWSRPGGCGLDAWAPRGGRIVIARHGSWTPEGRYRDGWIEIADKTGRTLRVFPGNSPAWSPDGRNLAFVRGSPHALWLTRVPGSGARRIAAEGHAPSSGAGLWSPDSRRLAYNADPGLYVVGLDGRVLRRLDDQPQGQFPKAWVSEQRLLVSRYHGETADLAVLSLTGGPTTVLDRFKVSDSRQLYTVALSPDHRTVAFTIATR